MSVSMKKTYLFIVCCLFICISMTRAQLSLTQPGVTATMNFDIPGLAHCTNTLTWTDNVTIPNCYTNRSVYAYSTGCSNTGAVHVAGDTANDETAFGGRASNSTPTIIWGIRVANNTGQAITALHIKYRAEQWAWAQSNVTNTITFSYRVSATPITDVTSGTYTAEPALNMSNFVTQGGCSGSGAAINGNDPAHSKDIYTCIQVNIPAGHEIMLRWYEINDGCNDHMMCIDDLEVTPVSGVTASVHNPPVCMGDSIRLSVRPILSGATYSWTGPGGFTATNTDTTLAPAVAAHAGAYIVNTNMPGCGSWSDTVDVVIAPPFTHTIADSICTGDTYIFAGNTLTTGGIYTDTLKSVSGCDSVIILELTVRPRPPAPQATDTIRYCQFDAATPLTAAGQDLLWYTATGEAALPYAPIPVTDTAGTTVYYVSQIMDGCESDRVPVVVVVLPAQAGFIVQPEPICAGDTAQVTFTGNAPVSSIFNWYWDGGIVHAGSGAGPYLVSWQEPGRHYPRMQLDNQGCISKVDTVAVFVRELPTAILEAPEAVCQGVRASLSASGGNEVSWYHDVSAVPEQRNNNGNTATVSWSSSGDKQIGVTVTDQHGCTSPLTFVPVHVYPLPEARIISVQDEAVCADDTAQLEAVQDPEYRYNWEPGYAVIGDHTQPFVMLQARRESFMVQFTVTDENNCTASDSSWVTVVPCCDIYLPNAFSPNGDGKNDIFRAIAKGPQRHFEFRIFNRWGNVVFATVRDTDGWDGRYNGEPAELGTYFYLLRYDCEGTERIMKGEAILVR